MFERKISGKGAVKVEKKFTLFISNKDMNDIIKITKSLEGWNSKTPSKKNKKVGFLEFCYHL